MFSMPGVHMWLIDTWDGPRELFSACNEISFAYAQCAIKFVPQMLSMECTCKNCSHFTAG
jgi:hypothetical protein